MIVPGGVAFREAGIRPTIGRALWEAIVTDSAHRIRTALAALAAGVGFTWPASLPALDLAHLDVCSRVPGAEVAGLADGSLKQARLFNDPDGDLARCTYFVAITASGAEAQTAFSIEVSAEEDFVEIRPYVEAPIHEVAGLGDGAWAYRDPDSMNRLRLYVLSKGVATLDVTGEDEQQVRKVAALAISKF